MDGAVSPWDSAPVNVAWATCRGAHRPSLHPCTTPEARITGYESGWGGGTARSVGRSTSSGHVFVVARRGPGGGRPGGVARHRSEDGLPGGEGPDAGGGGRGDRVGA